MNEELKQVLEEAGIPERLRAIEDAILTAAPEVWELKIVHTQLSAIMPMFFVLLLLALMSFFIRVLVVEVQEEDTDGDEVMASGIAATACGIAAFAVAGMNEVITRILVPEWHAIQDLVELVK